MSTFPDGLYQWGGIPVGGELLTWKRKNAKIYWVDGLNGTTGNDGLSYKRPLSTIAAAVTLMKARIDWAATPWAVGDILIIAPGEYAENLTTLPYGCSMIGLGDAFDLDGQRGVKIKPASGAPVDCTSVINMRIHNIAFESPDTTVCFQADDFNRNVVTDCIFAGLPGSSPTTVKGLETVKDMTGNRISNCVFQVVRNGIYVVTDNANSKQASGNIIEHCYIRGGDQTGIYFHANCVPSLTMINDCIIGGGGATLALGLDDDSDVVEVYNTMFEATSNDPVSGAGKYNHCYLNGALIT